jgi:hypothetical protein
VFSQGVVRNKGKNVNYSDWAYFGIAEEIIDVVADGEEVSLKEISDRLRSVNSGHRINPNAVNKTITMFLSEAFIPVGKNVWKVSTKEKMLLKRSEPK